MNNNVLITGLGVLCSAGKSIDEFADNVAGARQCFSRIDDPRLQHLRAKYAGLIPEFDAAEYVEREDMLKLDRFVHYAIAAAQQALDSAGVDPAALGSDMGLVFATCSGPMLSIENHYQKIVEGNEAVSEEQLFAKRYYSGAACLRTLFGIEGFSTTVTTACSASASAIGIASDLISQGILKAALVGGSDTFSPTTLAGFDGLKATAETICAPFSKPVGLNLGEGAGFVVLEESGNARRRSAPVYAQVLGYGLSNDAYHCSAPDPSGRGQSLAMQRSLDRAGLQKESISYVNAHGTGTAANDKAETKAIIRVFNEHADSTGVSSSKSIFGHCLGAAGCLEIIASIACARKGVFPPTAHSSGAREGCTLDYIAEPGRPWDSSSIFMSNSFAFGGNNASVIIKAGNNPAESEAPQQVQTACITGCGVLSAAGIGIDALVSAVSNAKACISRSAWRCMKAKCGLVPEFNTRDIDRRLDVRTMDRPSLLATCAAKLALDNAAYSSRPRDLAEVGLYAGLSIPSSAPESEHVAGLFRQNFLLSQVQAFPYIVPNSIAGNVSRALGLKGHNTVLCGSPGSGLTGLGLAAMAISLGHTDACLAGAQDELSQRIVADLTSAGIIGTDTAGVAAEGAAMLMLESEISAERRNARILAKIAGMAFSADIEHLMCPDNSTSRLQHTIKKALDAAGVGADDIGIVCCDSDNGRNCAALEKIIGPLNGRSINITSSIGAPQSALPFLSICYALAASPVESNKRTNYILCSFSSPQGDNSVLVLQRPGN